MTLEDLTAVPPARLPFPVTRAVAQPVEADGDGMPTMRGHFSTFGDWYEVDSLFEGHFMESVGKRAFDKTIAESREQMKVLYDHGHDPQIGNKILGPIEELKTDRTGPAYTVPLFDTSYNRDLAPGLKAGVYGSSFRFTVEKDAWNHQPERSDYNPDGIPERTITEARVFEFGPVTFPANPKATAGARSTTDSFYQRSRDPEQFEALLRSAQVARTPVRAGAADTSDEPPVGTPEEPPDPDTPRKDGGPVFTSTTYTVGEKGPEVFIATTAGTILPSGSSPPDEPAPTPQDPPEGGSSDSQENSVDTKEYTSREEKVARVNELRASIAKIDEEATGELEPALQARWDAENRELDAHERDIRAIDERKNRLTALGARKENTESEAPNVIVRKSESDIFDVAAIRSASRSREEYRGKVRDNALRAVELTRWPTVRADHAEAAGRISQFIEYRDHEVGEGADDSLAERMLLIGSPAYRHAFVRYLRSGGQERAAALAVGVDGTGGFAVPVAFDPTVIAIGAWTAINPYRTVCRTVSITGTDTWQALTATAVPAVYALEAAAATEQGPTFARPEFIVKRAHSFITASYEMAQDRPDLAAELSVLFGEGKDTLEEAQFTIGVGTTAFPQGAGLKDAYTRTDSAVNDTVSVADVRAVEAALPIRHRMNAVWFLSRAAIRAIQAFETTGGQLFNGVNYAAVGNPQSNAGGNTGLTLLGYPVYENPSMPWTPTTDDTTWGLLFNPQTYVIVDRVGMSVKVIPDILDAKMPTGEIGIYAFWRNTARVLNVDGGRQGAVQ